MKNATLVFDLDGTLVDSAPDLVAATNHALADLGLEPIAAGTLRGTIGFGARRMILEGLNQTGRTLPEAEVDRLLARFLAYYEPNIARESRPFDGVVAALESFRSRGARLAVCTNKRLALATHLLAELNLDGLFDAVAGRDSFPVFKPHPDHVLGAIRMAGGDPRHAVMIGDTAIDVSAAKAAAVPAVVCTFGYSDQPVDALGADAVIGHFSELDAAVRRLLAPASAGPSG
ncbi:MAG: HAD-IA family hydrolase [Hyphomicrobium sp.]|jgi:phosphoglycolate phosphatase|uniref:HAD-IA family hydrolase n=1 Tax=Hyphomicrobium sp. TaxID=82 RepID=UPI0025B8B397|nr:HAD-IA family hydrolase [Hyphomicrobium sp.]MBX9862973.1 HAD-IA family hydrolase [Hyphomicrobium sp.]